MRIPKSFSLSLLRDVRWLPAVFLVVVAGIWAGPAAGAGQNRGPEAAADPSGPSAVGESFPDQAGRSAPDSAGSADWQDSLDRLRDLSSDQARVRAQQEGLRRRASALGNLGDRVRERLAQRLHELDAQERSVRKRKGEELERLAATEGLRAHLENALAEVAIQEAETTSEEGRDRLEAKRRDLQFLLENLEEIQRNPQEFVDRVPGETTMLAEPGLEPLEPGGEFRVHLAARRIQQIEQQLRFMRQKMTELERELDDLKRLLAKEGSEGGGPYLEPGERLPPPAGPDRWRPPRDRWPGPQRDAIPPAGFAPGAQPGLRPDPRLERRRPGLGEPNPPPSEAEPPSADRL